MNWLHPEFLWALTALAIPIAIHLFNFRRYKPLYFSNIRWLKTVQQQTKKQSQLKHLLILLARMLAYAFIILAFAQPYFPSASTRSNTAKNYVTIYLDNSFSMAGTAERGQLLDIGRTYAYEIINAYSSTDQYRVITNNFKGEDRIWRDQQSAKDQLSAIEISAQVKKTQELNARISTAQGAFAEESRHLVFIISDFQQSSTQLSAIDQDSNTVVHLLPVYPDKRENLSIDSVAFVSPLRSPEGEMELKTFVRNYGADTILTGIEVLVNGNSTSKRSLYINPYDQADSTVMIQNTSAPIQEVELRINDIPITFDNSFFLSYTLSQQINVLELYENKPSGYLSKLFKSDTNFVFSATSVLSVNLESVGQQDLIILSNVKAISSGLATRLVQFVADGGDLVLFPTLDAEAEDYRDLFERFNLNGYEQLASVDLNMSTPDLNHLLYKNVFQKIPERLNTPQVKRYWKTANNRTANALDVLHLPNDDPILQEHTYGKGKVYRFTIALQDSSTNFHKVPLFVPTLLNMALYSESVEAAYYFLRQGEAIPLKQESGGQERLFAIRPKAGTYEYLPEYQIKNNTPALVLSEQLDSAGFYQVVQKQSGAVLQPAALNYDRTESDPTLLSREDLSNYLNESAQNITLIEGDFETVGASLSNLDSGFPIWKWCVILALVFLVAEMALVRLLK